MKTHSRYESARKALLFWCLFIGAGAVTGAVGMLAQPDGSALGMDAMLPYFQVLPFADVLFADYVFPGIALLVVNGFSNLTAAGLLLAKKKAGVTLGGLFGVTLMLWIVIQFVIFPLNVMSTLYFCFGLAQAATGYAASVFYRQERFCVRREDYPRIGTSPHELVVFFSRMGYTRKVAYETANQSGAEVCELHATEPTEGTPGFWWCGRYGMHQWPMPVEALPVELKAYDRVTICSAVWTFGLAAPVRAFCQAAAGKLKRVDYVLLHHTGLRYGYIADQMDGMLGVRRDSLRSIRCRVGVMKELTEPTGGK